MTPVRWTGEPVDEGVALDVRIGLIGGLVLIVAGGMALCWAVVRWGQ